MTRTLSSMSNDMPDPVSDPDPTDPNKDQDPTHPEAAQNNASDEHGLTDEQLEKAAGGIVGVGGFGGEGGTAGSVD